MSSTATLHTSLGDIVIELYPNHAPKTVANFVELATGAKEWTDPRDGKKTTKDTQILGSLKPGEKVSYKGITIQVVSSNKSGDTIKVTS